MNTLLEAIANFITEHYILTFLLLTSIFQVRINIGKRKPSSKEESEKAKNEKEKPL